MARFDQSSQRPCLQQEYFAAIAAFCGMIHHGAWPASAAERIMLQSIKHLGCVAMRLSVPTEYRAADDNGRTCIKGSVFRFESAGFITVDPTSSTTKTSRQFSSNKL
jgi:hypothetical protein